MKLGLRAAAAVVVVAALGFGAGGAGARSTAVTAQQVIGGLDFPAAFTFAPDGRIFYGIRGTGEIRVYDPGTGTDTHFFTIANVTSIGEQGLLGLTIPAGYPSPNAVYAYVTRLVSGTPQNQIVRIRNATQLAVLFRAPAADHHDGGHIAFSPGGKLFAVIGENNVPANAQDLSTPAGKIVRLTAGGAVPAGNPFPGSPVWASGIRNSFGFTFDPATGWLWESDNGPECNDELNLIRKGGNYGWGPAETCSTPPPAPEDTNQDGPSPILPKRWYTPPIAPTGLTFCHGCGLGAASEGALFFGTFNTAEIRRAILGPNRGSIVSESTVYSHGSGILSVESAPDGTIYFSDAQGIFKLVQA
jgi:glucose/arabinose dehydrogenase